MIQAGRKQGAATLVIQQSAVGLQLLNECQSLEGEAFRQCWRRLAMEMPSYALCALGVASAEDVEGLGASDWMLLESYLREHPEEGVSPGVLRWAEAHSGALFWPAWWLLLRQDAATAAFLLGRHPSPGWEAMRREDLAALLAEEDAGLREVGLRLLGLAGERETGERGRRRSLPGR